MVPNVRGDAADARRTAVFAPSPTSSTKSSSSTPIAIGCQTEPAALAGIDAEAHSPMGGISC
jgi:hypothetical protein